MFLKISRFSRMTCALAQFQDFRAYESHSKFNAQPQTHCARCEVISMMWCDEQSSSRKWRSWTWISQTVLPWTRPRLPPWLSRDILGVKLPLIQQPVTVSVALYSSSMTQPSSLLLSLCNFQPLCQPNGCCISSTWHLSSCLLSQHHLSSISNAFLLPYSFSLLASF